MPLTDCSRFGAFCSPYTDAAGEGIRSLRRDDAAGLPDDDYWSSTRPSSSVACNLTRLAELPAWHVTAEPSPQRGISPSPYFPWVVAHKLTGHIHGVSEGQVFMSDDDAVAGQDNLTDGGIQQVPALVRVREVPAAAEARDKLLAAIAAEAQRIGNQPTGKASEALERLARAYALVTAGGTALTTSNEATVVPLQTRAGGHQVGLCLELEP